MTLVKRGLFVFTVTLLLALILLPKFMFATNSVKRVAGVDVSLAQLYWENSYAIDPYDALGPGIFLAPYMQGEIARVRITGQLTGGYARFTGPDGLTITGPAVDIDAGFTTRLLRQDFTFTTSYKLTSFLWGGLQTQYAYLHLHGKHPAHPVTYDYCEQGWLVGPTVHVQKRIPQGTFLINLAHLSGALHTDYRVSRNRQDLFQAQLTTAQVGFQYPVNTTIAVTGAVTAQVYEKRGESNVRQIGIMGKVSYALPSVKE